MNKYISTKDAVRLTGLSTQEIYDLIHEGKLPAHKAPKSGWRILPEDLEELGLIRDKSAPIVEEPQTEGGVAYVADEEHYRALHPEYQTLENRMRCLKDLKALGYQTGCGIMAGTPGQTPQIIAKDMKFMEEFQPEMIGVGPFLPHKDTPFRDEKKGSVELTLFILALCRIMIPKVLLPSTPALGTAESEGRKQGVLAGCNVVMPNLSPLAVLKKYMLYDEKAGTDISAAEGIQILKKQMEEIGYEVVVGRGDFGKER